jgi:capsular polysaccharide export protein
MISSGLTQFKGKKIALLQGPVGPFFSRFAQDLTWAGAQVCKINFNGGDWLFFTRDCTLFRGTSQQWPAFLEAFLLEKQIDQLFLFGDCRSIHLVAHDVARKLGIPVGVFEEGYVRPDYITLEKNGVNARSSLPKSPLAYLNSPEIPCPEALPVGRIFRFSALWAILYYAASHALRPLFPHYEHHRPLNIWEGLYWLRGFWRRRNYARKERHVLRDLSGPLSRRYFLVPLQVPTDSQLLVHSEYQRMDGFISVVLRSFAAHADSGTSIVFKHHPLDRGYNNYAKLIAGLSRQLGLHRRVLYIHDQPLSPLLDHAIGVVVVNSTVGFSAIHHGKPVKPCGIAFYDMHGLTFQGALDDFWSAAPTFRPDPELYRRFREHVIRHTQLNGNFYRRLEIPGMACGLVYPPPSPVSSGDQSFTTQNSTLFEPSENIS